ncbi:MAG: sensor histidine kinase [Bacteroidia bacterium]
MKKSVVLLLHIGYWFVFLVLLWLFLGLLLPVMTELREPGYNDFTLLARQWFKLMLGFAIVPGVISFYINYTVVFNRFLKQRRMLLFFFAVIGTVVLSVATGLLVFALIHHHLFAYQRLDALIAISLVMSFGALMNGVVGLVMKGFISWYSDLRMNEERQRKTTEMELALIRAQLNPHFLFNTINNIDVLIAKDPAAASDYLNQLSGILRYLLYESPQGDTELSNELKHLENYIALQRIRSANQNYISYTVSGNVNSLRIAPMILLPFVENAFKYSTNKKRDDAVKISAEIAGNTLHFECSNYYETQQEAYTQGGLGNALIKRRLALVYPGKHQLKIVQDADLYIVKLTLELSKA